MSTRVGEKIRKIRESLHMERSEFSLKTGIPRDTLVSAELGRREPGAAMLILITAKWPQYAAYLLTDENIKQVNPESEAVARELINQKKAS